MLDTDRSPNAVSVHAGTSQVDFEVDRPPPAPPGRLLITMVKEAVFCTKNEFPKMKKILGLSLIDLKVMKTRNDCEIACDCVKRANVVLHVGLCKEIFARKHTATHKPTSAQPLYSYQRDIHTSNKIASRYGAPRTPMTDVGTETAFRLDQRMLDTDRSPNAVSVHAGTSQVDFEVDCPPPARSTKRSFDHHGKGNGNFV